MKDIKFITTKTYIDFFRIFGELILGGTDVIEALSLLENKKKMHELPIPELIESYKKGDKLHNALRKLNFPKNFCNIVEIGEETGSIGRVLVTYSKIEEENRALKKKIISLLMPFFIVLIASIGTLFIGSKMMIPMLSGLFDALNAELPLPTQILVSFADNFVFWSISFVASIIIGIIFFRFIPVGKRLSNRIALNNVLLGNYIELRQLYILASLLILFEDNGVDILDGLERIDDLFGIIYKEKIQDILFRHRQGDNNIWESVEGVDILFDGSLMLYDRVRDTNTLKSFIDRVDQSKSRIEKSLETRIEFVSLVIGGIIILGLGIALLLPTIAIDPSGIGGGM